MSPKLVLAFTRQHRCEWERPGLGVGHGDDSSSGCERALAAQHISPHFSVGSVICHCCNKTFLKLRFS